MSNDRYCIFLSCGSPDNEAQEDFVSLIEDHLRLNNCEPQTVGRSKYSARQPVQAARDLIGTCDGAIVIAFERTRIIQGIEKPNSTSPKIIEKESHPTIWNQMEASMAYAQKVPILTLVQSGLKRQGMLSDRLEWAAIESDLTQSVLRSEEFKQVFSEWLMYVGNEKNNRSKNKKELDIGQISVGQLIFSLKPNQMYAVIVAFVAIISASCLLSFKIGQNLNKDLVHNIEKNQPK
jgi:hypothetical protein